MIVPDKVVIGFFSAAVLAMATVIGLLWGSLREAQTEKQNLVERVIRCESGK